MVLFSTKRRNAYTLSVRRPPQTCPCYQLKLESVAKFRILLSMQVRILTIFRTFIVPCVTLIILFRFFLHISWEYSCEAAYPTCPIDSYWKSYELIYPHSLLSLV